jgi:hypothetical protein
MTRPKTPFRGGMTAERHAMRTARIERLLAELRDLVLASDDDWRVAYSASWLNVLRQARFLTRQLKQAPQDKGWPGDPGAAA